MAKKVQARLDELESYPSLEALALALNVSVRRVQQFQAEGRLTVTRDYKAPKREMDELRSRNGGVRKGAKR